MTRAGLPEGSFSVAEKSWKLRASSYFFGPWTSGQGTPMATRAAHAPSRASDRSRQTVLPPQGWTMSRPGTAGPLLAPPITYDEESWHRDSLEPHFFSLSRPRRFATGGPSRCKVDATTATSIVWTSTPRRSVEVLGDPSRRRSSLTIRSGKDEPWLDV